MATLGFRGEALAAIASVAELAITSRTADAPHATRLDARSGELQPTARGVGTTVEVRELFFSTPARRKFLKTEATELAHCLEAVRRQAIVRPEIGFAVWHDGKAVANWSRATLPVRTERRARQRVHRPTAAWSASISAACSIAGRAGTPESARGRADLQYVFVNGRHVRDKLIAHAIRAAYDDVLHGGRHPAYLLYIEVAPERVDVNVHPAKTEVRFRDSREVHEAVRKAVQAALAVAVAAATDAETARDLIDRVTRTTRHEPDRFAETPAAPAPDRLADLALRAAEPLPSSWAREPARDDAGPVVDRQRMRRRARTGRSAAPSPRSPAPSSSPRTPAGW